MELELYSTIEYTPGWYYNKYPKFWNVECYKILSDYSNHPRDNRPETSKKEEKKSKPPNLKKSKT
jgi:hypothetical protein